MNKQCPMGLRLTLILSLSAVLLGSTLFAQTPKQLDWIKKHPNSPLTKRWAKNNPEHPLVKRWRARRAASNAKAPDVTAQDDVTTEPRAAAEEPPPKQPIGPVRMWKDSTGNHRVEAALMEYGKTSVTLKKIDDGGIVILPIDKLSENDQKHLDTWSHLSSEARINILAKDIERRCTQMIATADRELAACAARKEKLVANRTRDATIRQEKAWVIEQLKQSRDKTPHDKVREDYAAAIQRWESGEPTDKDLKRGYSIVHAQLTASEREVGRQLRELKNELKWARRRATHIIQADDSPYIEVDGGFYTDAELAAAEKELIDRAALRKQRGTPRLAADWYVQRLLDAGTIQKAVFVAEGPVNLDPRWRVPGNQLDPLSFRVVTYRVDYVSTAGVQMQKQGRVVVQRQREGHWDPTEGFDFVVFPLWTPSGEALEQAFGSPASSLSLPPRK